MITVKNTTSVAENYYASYPQKVGLPYDLGAKPRSAPKSLKTSLGNKKPLILTETLKDVYVYTQPGSRVLFEIFRDPAPIYTKEHYEKAAKMMASINRRS